MKKQLKAGIHTNRENNSVHTTRPNKLHKIAKAISSVLNILESQTTVPKDSNSKCVATVEPNKQHHLLQEHRNTSTHFHTFLLHTEKSNNLNFDQIYTKKKLIFVIRDNIIRLIMSYIPIVILFGDTNIDTIFYKPSQS